MKVLIIDDVPDSVKGIADYCKDQNWTSKIVDFDSCFKEIMISDPDVIVLDWYSSPEDDPGMEILESVWTNGYRPMVIFSGNAEIISLPEEYTNSGLIKIIPKGDESPVYRFLDDFKDSHSAISSFRKELGKSVVEAFRVLEPIQESSDNYLGDEVIKYIMAKRSVSYFDLEKSNVLLPPWAIYQYPPTINSFLTACDILRKIDSETDLMTQGTPEDYLIVLTPSCDMVVNEKRTPKVENVLFAQCQKISDSHIGNTRKYDKIRKALSSPKENEIPLPAMSNILPDMVVNLKRLGTVNINKIALNTDIYTTNKDNYEYIRICSIDSPFREKLVWYFVSNIGRIGVPDIDSSVWAKNLMSLK